MKAFNRRIVLQAGAPFLISLPAIAADVPPYPMFNYRGFRVDISEINSRGDIAEILISLKSQIDMVADCGCKPEIVEFFRGRPIAIMRRIANPPGQFIPGQGVELELAIFSAERPILLHELLHAYHFRQLPDGYRNADVLAFFEAARKLYPQTETHEGHRTATYLLTNQIEYFAVTASVYLWGFVDREPHGRSRLKELQPTYYTWLGEQFGVEK